MCLDVTLAKDGKSQLSALTFAPPPPYTQFHPMEAIDQVPLTKWICHRFGVHGKTIEHQRKCLIWDFPRTLMIWWFYFVHGIIALLTGSPGGENRPQASAGVCGVHRVQCHAASESYQHRGCAQRPQAMGQHHGHPQRERRRWLRTSRLCHDTG